jgi:FkbM family methyltransferase
VAEQEVMRRIVREGDVVYDVGANIGMHLSLLSRLVGPAGQAHAFEPNPELHALLALTVAQLSNATLHRCGLGERSEVAKLFIPRDPSMASLRDWTAGRQGEPPHSAQLSCAIEPMDALRELHGLPRPDFIKCDVEGAELQVFRGGAQTLGDAVAPVVLFEANAHTAQGFGLTVDSARAYLAELSMAGYRFFVIEEAGRLRRVDRCTEVHASIVAVPWERLDRVAELLHPAGRGGQPPQVGMCR